MFKLISFVYGVCAGYFVCNINKLVPSAYQDYIGNSIATSDVIKLSLNAIIGNPEIQRSIHLWIIVLGVVIIPIILSALLSFLVYRWTKELRYIIYAGLIPILYSILVTKVLFSVYLKEHLAWFLPLIDRANDNLTIELVSIVFYLTLLNLFSFVFKSHAAHIENT